MEEAGEKSTVALMSALQRRDARPEDAAIIVLWFPTRQDAVWWGGPAVPDPPTAEWLIEQFALGFYWVWTDRNDEIQAVAGLKATEGGVAWLNRFGIAPAMRGRGLAAQLVKEIIDIARRRGDTKVSLGVYGSNLIARRVYDGLGFRAISQREAEEDASGISINMQRDL